MALDRSQSKASATDVPASPRSAACVGAHRFYPPPPPPIFPTS